MTLGVMEAHRNGVVTACSLVANGRDFDHAVALLRSHPALDVGVHLTFVGERPLSPLPEVRSLITREGTFVRDHRAFLWRYYAGELDLGELEREARRQIERIRDAGIALVHLNGHQHLHVVPRVLEMVARLAQEYAIPYVRVPRDALGASPRVLRWLSVRALSRFGERAARSLASTRLRVNDRTIGIAEAGHLRFDRLVRLLDRVSGVTELVGHPGVEDAAIAREYGWGYEWDAERSALCDPLLRERIARAGITLGGIRSLLTS